MVNIENVKTVRSFYIKMSQYLTEFLGHCKVSCPNPVMKDALESFFHTYSLPRNWVLEVFGSGESDSEEDVSESGDYWTMSKVLLGDDYRCTRATKDGHETVTIPRSLARQIRKNCHSDATAKAKRVEELEAKIGEITENHENFMTTVVPQVDKIKEKYQKLEREKALVEKNYKDFTARVKKMRIDRDGWELEAQTQKLLIDKLNGEIVELKEKILSVENSANYETYKMHMQEIADVKKETSKYIISVQAKLSDARKTIAELELLKVRNKELAEELGGVKMCSEFDHKGLVEKNRELEGDITEEKRIQSETMKIVRDKSKTIADLKVQSEKYIRDYQDAVIEIAKREETIIARDKKITEIEGSKSMGEGVEQYMEWWNEEHMKAYDEMAKMGKRRYANKLKEYQRMYDANFQGFRPLKGWTMELHEGNISAGKRECQQIDVCKIVGHNGLVRDWMEGWIPDSNEFHSSRYQRILAGACMVPTDMAGHFLSNLGMIHLYYVEKTDEYYVMSDGHRRVSVAHLLGVEKIGVWVERCSQV